MSNNFTAGVAGAAFVIAVLALFVSLRDTDYQVPAPADVTAAQAPSTSEVPDQPVQATVAETSQTVAGTVPLVTVAPETTLTPTTTIAAPGTTEELPGEPSGNSDPRPAHSWESSASDTPALSTYATRPTEQSSPS